MSRFRNFAEKLTPSGAVEQLLKPDDPEPRQFRESSRRMVKSQEYDVNKPQDEIEEYWRLYETNPLISFPINTAASKVMEPGWYITADSEDTIDELTEFCENVAIVNGEPHKNLSQLGEQAVIQHQVKGSFIAERVTNDDGKPTALNPLQPETFEIYTKPDSNILLAPDDTQLGGVKKTSSGDAAAYVQFDESDPRWDKRDEKRFSRDQILKWTRGNEVGEVFGTSRVESVYERALALEAKLRDNDDAIAMKAWPMVLFEMGSEDNPWRKGEIEDFMSDFDAENFGPGLMKAVSGDVSVEEFAGETADIEGAVNTDVSFIMAGMPGPKYSLGGFEANVGKAVATAQDRQYTKLVRRLRRDLEELLTPYLREVAEAYDLDAADSVELNIQRPEGEVPPEDVSGSIIRYTSDADPSNQGSPGQQAIEKQGGAVDGDRKGSPGEGINRGQNSREMSTPDVELPEGSTELLSADSTAFSCDQCAVEELADPRLVSTTDLEGTLTDAVYEVLETTRNRTLSRIQDRYSTSASVEPSQLDQIVESAFADAVATADLTHTTERTLQDTAEKTLETFGQENHDPQLTVAYTGRHARYVRQNVQALRDDVETVRDDLLTTFTRQLGQSGNGSEAIERWAERSRNTLDSSQLRERARLIAHMRIQRVVNTIKLNEYERADAITGVQIVNPCTEATTPLCERLAGCDHREPSTAQFDAERPVGEQLERTVPDELMYDGFSPLPPTPPFHYGCRSELVPIVSDE